jgi:hypothetical protein
LIRATVYESITAARKVALHRKAAEAIEMIHADALDGYVSTLAHHWAKASAPVTDVAKAVEYARRAGDRAMAQLANDEAAGYYASALELLDAAGAGPHDPRRLELLIGRGEAQRRAGDLGYRETLLDAAGLARQLGDASGLARAALANTMGDIWTGGFQVDAARIEVLEAALAAVGEGEPRLRARLLATLGLELFWDPDADRRLQLSGEALTIARTLADRGTLASVLLARDYTIHAPDNARERFDATTEVLSIAEDVGDRALASRALGLRFKAAMELADMPEAERALARNREIVGDLGQPTLTWATIHHDATLLILRGDAEAEAAIAAAHEFATSAGRSDAMAFYLSHLFCFLWHRGRLGELEEPVRRYAERARTLFTKALHARILADTGRTEDAAGVFDELAAIGFAHPTNNTAWLWFHIECAWLCAHLHRTDCVARLRSALQPYADQLVVGGFAGFVAGPVAFYLGILAATVADWPAADAHFAAATATQERIGARPWLARTRLEWARMLLAVAEPGDGERAHDLLRQALTTARDLGLVNIERGAAELLSSQ